MIEKKNLLTTQNCTFQESENPNILIIKLLATQQIAHRINSFFLFIVWINPLSGILNYSIPGGYLIQLRTELKQQDKV